MFICPRLRDGGLSGGTAHVIDGKRTGTDQLLHVGGIFKYIEMNNARRIYAEIVPVLPFLIAVALAVDFLLQLVAQRVNALG